jgi:hypothetical protein
MLVISADARLTGLGDTLYFVANDGIHGRELWKLAAISAPVDDVPPTISITRPTHGASYPVGVTVTADFSCSDAADPQPSCVATDGGVPITPGGALDTATPGTRTFSVEAEDAAGNSSSRSVTYSVTPASSTDDNAPATPDPAPPLSGPAGPLITPAIPGQPATPRFVAPKRGKVRVNRKGRLRLRFRCDAAARCAPHTFALRGKVRKHAYRVRVRVTALEPGQRARVTVRLPRKAASAVRRAGRRGIKAALKSKGTRTERLRLVA